ncbi:MAG: LuxR C-terminal-related transcriptional regulator [Jatrophihabitantaceae bacterium]
MSAGIQGGPLTLLSAVAGSGKTVLAASWAATRPVPWPVAWLTLDSSDNLPVRFWAYVVDSLRRAGLDLAGLQEQLDGEYAEEAYPDRLAATLLSLPQPVVLVLDDADCLTNPAILTGLEFLLRNAADRFRLLMCTRADPQLPLHKYRLSDTVTELRIDSLAFTEQETQELFERLGQPLDAESARALTQQTEGWAAGIRLAAVPLLHGADPTELIESLANGEGSVAEYLFTEVLHEQDTPMRQFLLRTSVADRLQPELADLLTDRTDSRRMLATLAHANTFVERDSRAPNTYRIHNLFRAMLRVQLGYESPELTTEMHRRCAKWYKGHGDTRHAVRHAAAAQDWATVSSVLIDDMAIGVVLARDAPPCDDLLSTLQSGVTGRAAAVLRAAWAVHRGEPALAEDVVDTAALAHDETESLPRQVSAAVVVSALGAAAEQDPAQSVRAADHAVRLISQLSADQRAEHPELSAVTLTARAGDLLCLPGTSQHGSALASAIAACERAHLSRLRRQAYGELALVEAVQGQLRKATAHAQVADGATGESVRTPDVVTAAAALAMAWVHCEEFDHVAARRWADLAIARSENLLPESRFVEPLLAVVRARLLRMRRDLESAVRVLQPFVAAVKLPDWVREQVVLEAVRLQLAQGRPELALGYLDALPNPRLPSADLLRRRAVLLGAHGEFEPRDCTQDEGLPVSAEVDAWIDLAYTLLDRGQTSDAVAALDHALQLAQPEGLRRPFLDSTSGLRKLMRVELSLVSSAAWLSPNARQRQPGPSRPAAHIAHPEPAGPEPLIQPLTERELEVLRYLSDLLTTDEVAAAMFVSVNTVRTHVRSILQKLAVSRRNEAVRRARQLNLL